MFGFCLSWENSLEISRRGGCLLIIGSQVRALVRPPSSLRKPHVSDTPPNRAFLRGFPATHFLDFGLCRRSRILVAFLTLCLSIQKFRSVQPGFEHQVGPHRTRNCDLWAAVVRDLREGAAAYSGLSPSASNCRLHSV